MTHSYLVYWIKLPSHQDPFTEGYIGITNNFDRRWKEHLKRGHIGDKIRQYGISKEDVVFLNDGLDNHAVHFLEEVYRPIRQIGWNRYKGGAWTAVEFSDRKTRDYTPTVSCIHCKKSFFDSNWTQHQRGSVIHIETRECWPLKKFLRHHKSHRA